VPNRFKCNKQLTEDGTRGIISFVSFATDPGFGRDVKEERRDWLMTPGFWSASLKKSQFSITWRRSSGVSFFEVGMLGSGGGRSLRACGFY
jgi:hypothetical protein